MMFKAYVVCGTTSGLETKLYDYLLLIIIT